MIGQAPRFESIKTDISGGKVLNQTIAVQYL